MSWTAPSFDGSCELRAAASVEHWVAAAKAASDRHHLACAAPTLFDSGSDIVVDCGGHVFKMTAPRWKEEIDTEKACLARVDGRLGVATPEVLASGELDAWPYLLMSRLEGRALESVWPGLESSQRRRLAEALGELVARLHFLEVHAGEASLWPDFLDRMRRGVILRLAGAPESEEWLRRIEPFLDSLEPMSPRRPRLLHTEIYHQHVLVEEKQGSWELTGLIDFADARVGHPYYEIPALVEFLFRGERPLLRDFLRAYGLSGAALDEDLTRELCGWGLLHQFGSLPRMLEAAGPPKPQSLGEFAHRLYGFD